MQLSTLNQIRDRIETLCLDNPLVRSYQWEEQAEQDTEVNYPLAHAFVGEGSNQVGNVLFLPITIMFMDLVQKDSSNKFEVSSDMMQVCKNVLSNLYKENDLFILDDQSISFEDFYTEKFDTEACGWILTLVLKVANPYDSCDLPYTPSGGGSVTLERTDNTLIETIAAPATRELDDLIIEVVDEDENPILTLNQLVYTEQTLDLSILAECNNLINLNNLIVSNTQPVGQPNGHYWFQPL
jgi:hypothetical protein